MSECPICGEEWAAYQETHGSSDDIIIRDHHERVCSQKNGEVWRA